MGYEIAGGLGVKMADPSRGVYEGDLAILERLAQAVLLTGSQAQPTIAISGRHVATHKSRVERLEKAVPNLVRFSALPKGLSDEQLEKWRSGGTFHSPHAILARFSPA
jgi:hypothetical protein